MTEIRHRAIQRKCFAFFSLVIWRAPGAGCWRTDVRHTVKCDPRSALVYFARYWGCFDELHGMLLAVIGLA